MTNLFDRFITAAKQTGLKVEKTTFKHVKIGSPYFTENNGLLIKVSINDIPTNTIVYIAR